MADHVFRPGSLSGYPRRRAIQDDGWVEARGTSKKRGWDVHIADSDRRYRLSRLPTTGLVIDLAAPVASVSTEAPACIVAAGELGVVVLQLPER